MPKGTLLFADNDPDFLKTRSEFLEREGYRVIPANTFTEARRVLEKGDVDLAILDLRLENDEDKKDTSGLTLAKEVAPEVPKIILTAFPNYKYVREVLRPQVQSLPVAVDFVVKKEGPEVLLQAVKSAIGFAPVWLRKTIDGTTKRLDNDYEDARRQSKVNYIASLVVAGIGIMIIFIGAVFAIRGVLAFGVASAVGGAITEAVTYLFFKRVDLANTRMDRYHAESLQFKHFETLLAACEGLSPSMKREACEEQVVSTMRIYWIGSVKREEISALSSTRVEV